MATRENPAAEAGRARAFAVAANDQENSRNSEEFQRLSDREILALEAMAENALVITGVVAACLAPVERPREIALHMAVVEVLRKLARPDWQWWHTPNGEPRSAREVAKLKALGVRAGVPDIVLVSPAGKLHSLELKAPGGRLSEAQQDFQTWAAARGLPHSVAESMRDVLAILNHWGVLRSDNPKA